VERSFTRKVAIPIGIHKDSIQCSVDEKGKICVVGTKQALEQSSLRNIPISYKPSGQQKQAIK